MDIIKKINALKKEKNAIVLGHYYLRPEIQQVADYIGDSYGLSKKAMDFQGDIIVFAGVRFMAETAKMLNPDKKVFLSHQYAGCPMADMVTAEDIRKMREKYDDLYVVCYVNSTAEVKAESDICITSRNAVDIVKSIPEKHKNILFVPDKNLGNYVKEKTGRDMIIWDGYCCVHNNLKVEKLNTIRKNDPDAKIIVHPECTMEIIKNADGAFSTAGMVDYIKKYPEATIYTGTEIGVLEEIHKINSNVKPVCEDMICKNMKKTTIEDLIDVLENEKNEIILDKNILERARVAIESMIEVTEKFGKA